jgi:LDH2 family malate/lactate/ureidoglycolate dehydrogenase
MTSITFDELAVLLRGVFINAGFAKENAQILARNCAMCERDGSLSHGGTLEHMEHCDRERNHQGLGNQLIAPTCFRQSQAERIDCRSRLGEVQNFYERAAG